jgi:hypothetical protein
MTVKTNISLSTVIDDDRLPARPGGQPLFLQTNSWAQLASYSVVTGRSFLWRKATEA